MKKGAKSPGQESEADLCPGFNVEFDSPGARIKINTLLHLQRMYTGKRKN